MNDAGRIGFVIRDDYDNNVQYDFLDVVYYHGNSYVAKKLTLGNIPNENNEYWHILTAGGVRVKGDAESEYRDGDVNITKENIGLANTEDKSSETIRSEITSENVTNALGYTPMNEDLDTYGQKESTTGSEKVIVNDDGEVKQVPMSEISAEYEISNTTSDSSGYIKIMDVKTIRNWGGVPIFFKAFNQVDYAYDVTVSPTGGSATSTTVNTIETVRLSSTSSTSVEPDFLAINEGNGAFSIWVKLRNGYEVYIGDLFYSKKYFKVTVNAGEGAVTTPKTLEEISELGTVVRSIDGAVMQGATETAPGLSGLVPAPQAGDEKKLLGGDGNWLYDGQLFRAFMHLSSPGWYRFFVYDSDVSVGTGTYGRCGIIELSRRYQSDNNESAVVVYSTSHANLVNWHTLSRTVSNKGIDKLRFCRKGGLNYIELHYTLTSGGNDIAAKCITNIASNMNEGMINFEPAEADETVISEYTIPDKDDISTSKSLTNFTEIPEGADVHDYIKLGNYSCSTNSKANSLLNCPLNSAFTLDVSKGVGEIDNIIIQTFFDYLGTKIVKVVYVSGSGWRQPNFFYSAQGTPPANKLWGTDANGNVGWIDPPPRRKIGIS